MTEAGRRWGRGNETESRYDEHNRHSTFTLRVETRRPPVHRPDSFLRSKGSESDCHPAISRGHHDGQAHVKLMIA